MITDWDDAYANGAHIPGAEDFPPMWDAEASSFRAKLAAEKRAEFDLGYGPGDRETIDLFMPVGTPKGLMVFVHGGYWMKFSPKWFSHLAAGAVECGWAAALPSYELAPAAAISEITQQIGQAIDVAARRIDGPIHIAGHSAGGHLVSRMVCADSPLSEATRQRLKRVVSISGLHDLRPLLKTEMNQTLKLDEAEARSESAALNAPFGGPKIVCWVGSEERPEFLRQNDLLVNIWTGLGADISLYHDDDKHHFDVIEGLATVDSRLTETLLG
ncbi:MAG: alpha/beta hydrolase [Rhizobiaceae bacterium]